MFKIFVSGNGGKFPQAGEEGSHLRAMLFGRGRKPCQLCLLGVLLGGDPGGQPDGFVLLEKITKGRRQRHGLDGPPSKHAQQKEAGEQLYHGPLPNFHAMI